jgi:7-keto-8-aminopelargonate synthetase-like enzyme
MGTLGKALGASGGFICGSRALTEYLVNRARSFIFSTAPVPAAAAAALAALQIAQSVEGDRRRTQLQRNIAQLESAMGNAKGPDRPPAISAIFPVLCGDESAALSAAETLRAHGIFVPAIRYPTVARGAARLRVTLTAAHSTDDVAQLVRALDKLGPKMA